MSRVSAYPGRINVSPNPVTPYGTFAASYGPGRKRAQFSSVVMTDHAFGGPFAMKFVLRGTRIELEEFYDDGLNRLVEAEDPDGETNFDGFVNTVRFSERGRIRKRSLDDVATTVRLRWKDSSGTSQVATATDQDAADRFGILELPVSGGQIETASQAQAAADLILGQKKNAPEVPEVLRLGGDALEQDDTYLEVEVLGFQWRLARRLYNQTASTGVQSADLEIVDILTATGQYLAPSGLWEISANPIAVRKDYNGDRDPLGICFDIARLGDALSPPQPWAFYFKVGMVPVYEPKAPSLDLDL